MEKQHDLKYYICLGITAIVVFGARFLPEIGVITEYGTTVVGIFIGVIFGYCTIGMILPSFMAFIALGFSGWGTVPEVLQTAIGNPTVLYIISILLLSAMFEQSGLANKLVNWFITRRFTKGKPWVISFMIMMAAYWASWFVSSIPPTFICWALLTDLFETVGYKKGDKWPIVIMFGVLFAAALGGLVPSFQIGIAANYGMLAAISGGTLVYNPLAYMGWAFILSMIIFGIYFVFAKYIIRPDVSLLMRDDLIEEDKTPLTKVQKITAVIFIMFVIGLLLPAVLPEGNSVKILLDTMGNCGWGLLMIFFAILIRIEGQHLFSFDQLFAKGIMWDIVFMMATVFTLATIVTEEITGVPDFISSIVMPMQSSMGTLTFVAVVSLIIVLLGNFTNTVAISCTFIPVLYVIADDMGLNMFLMVALINLIDNVCLLMPSASIYATMMYSKRDWIPGKWCIGFALFSMISIYAVAMIIGIPLGSIFF